MKAVAVVVGNVFVVIVVMKGCGVSGGGGGTFEATPKRKTMR